MAEKNPDAINQPVNKTPMATGPAETRRAAAKMATPIMQPPPGKENIPNPIGLPDEEEIENQLAGTKMAQPRPTDFNPANREPGTKVYDAKMILERRRRIMHNLGLSDLVLPPICKQTMATYRAIDNGKINPATQKPNDPTLLSLPGTYVFYDMGEGDVSRRSITMKNLSGKPGLDINPNTGKEEQVANASSWIEFFSGVTMVDTVKQYIKYVFLELHPLNASNRFRDKTIRPAFERIDIKPVRTFHLDAAEMDMARDAEDTVLAMDKDTVLAFAASANVVIMENGKTRRIDEIKHDLRVYARNSPKMFFSLAGNTKAAVRSNVIDLKYLGLIEFNPDKHFWFDFHTDQTIHVVPRGEDPTVSLVEMLNNPANLQTYEALVKLLNYWDRDDYKLAEYEAA